MHIEGETTTTLAGPTKSLEIAAGDSEMTRQTKIPLAVKLAYTLFVAILVPNYWRTYSPWTFLYFCDVALFLTLAGLWLESWLLISLAAVGLTVPQLLWVGDLLTGSHLMTSYMFDP